MSAEPTVACATERWVAAVRSAALAAVRAGEDEAIVRARFRLTRFEMLQILKAAR
jgi:hypothetical protein